MKPKEGVREIVERCRAGDQVAMALIIETRKQAEQGNKLAQKRRKEIDKYIAKHPPSTVAGDERLSVNTNPKAQLTLWSVRKSDPKKFATAVIQTAPFLGPWALVCAIFHGPKLTADCPLMATATLPNSKIAACTRQAFRLQRLDNPKVPIRSYCPMTAGELGE